jgi:DivIVA domain-containing protein
MRKKSTDDVADFAGGPAPKALGPADVQQKEFHVSRFGGYKMRDVDEFLDQVTESMNAMAEENRRMRVQGGGSMIGTPDLADTSRQADEIIQRARLEAQAIVDAARTQAAASPTADASTAPPTDRSAVNAFLAQERSFLQGLAGLIQEHAETVKGMVRADRKTGSPGSTTTSAPTPAASPAPTPAPPAARRPVPPARPHERPADPRPTAPMKTVDAVDAVDEPIRVDEPEPASARREDEGSGDGSDRSLRDLFWGED